MNKFENDILSFKKEFIKPIEHKEKDSDIENMLYTTGNLMVLAIKNNPVFKKQWEDYRTKYFEAETQLDKETEIANIEIKSIFEKYGLTFDVITEEYRVDGSENIIVDKTRMIKNGNTVLLRERSTGDNMLDDAYLAVTNILKEKSKFERYPEVIKYNRLANKITRLENKDNIFAKLALNIVKKQIKNVSSLALNIYKDMMKAYEKVVLIHDEFTSNREIYIRKYNKVTKTKQKEVEIFSQHKSLKNNMTQYAYDLLTLASIKLFNNYKKDFNYNEIKATEEMFKELKNGEEYYAKFYLNKIEGSFYNNVATFKIAAEIYNKEHDNNFEELSITEQMTYYQCANLSKEISKKLYRNPIKDSIIKDMHKTLLEINPTESPKSLTDNLKQEYLKYLEITNKYFGQKQVEKVETNEIK